MTDAAPGTVEEIAAALREDPVLVQSLMGNGHTAAVTEALREKAEQVDLPVYVVLTQTPTGLPADTADEDLARLLHGELGGDGVYVVHTDNGYGAVEVYGDLYPHADDDEVVLSLARYDAIDQMRADHDLGEHGTVPAVTEAAVLLDAAAVRPPAGVDYRWRPELSSDDLETYAVEPWTEPPSAGGDSDSWEHSVGLEWMLASLVGVTVTVVGYRLLRARAAWAAPEPPRSDVQVDRVRDLARDEVGRLVRALTRVRADHPGATDALACRVAAERHLDSRDHLDVVGALVLARSGRHAIESRPGTPPYRCCFLNPLHGRGTRAAEVGPGASVPVCATCAGDLAAGRRPDTLPARRGRKRPYYEGSGHWARTGYGSVGDRFWTVEARR